MPRVKPRVKPRVYATINPSVWARESVEKGAFDLDTHKRTLSAKSLFSGFLESVGANLNH